MTKKMNFLNRLYVLLFNDREPRGSNVYFKSLKGDYILNQQ